MVEPVEYGHGAEDDLGVLCDALLERGWPPGRVRAIARVVSVGLHYDGDVALWMQPLWEDEDLQPLLNAARAWPVDGPWYGPDYLLPCSLASLLPSEWRWLGDATRNTVVLLHTGGLWIEVDADGVLGIGGDAARAIVGALGAHVEGGATGRHAVTVGYADHDGERAWSVSLDPMP